MSIRVRNHKIPRTDYVHTNDDLGAAKLTLDHPNLGEHYVVWQPEADEIGVREFRPVYAVHLDLADRL